MTTLQSLQLIASIARNDGGPSTAAVSLANHIQRQDVSPLVATTSHGLQRNDTLAIGTNRGPEIVICRPSRPHSLKNSWTMWLTAVREARRRDVVHLHGVYLANSLMAFAINLLTHTPYVVQPHGALEPYQRRQGRFKKKVYDRVIGARIMRGASAIIAASPQERRNLMQLYPDARIEVIPPGVARNDIAEQPPPRRTRRLAQRPAGKASALPWAICQEEATRLASTSMELSG